MPPGQDAGWPAHGRDVREWRQGVRAGTREDRTLRQVEVSLPPLIADLDVVVDGDVAATMEVALREVGALDAEHGADLDALETLLLRTESVASSKIEHVEATIDDYARALHGMRGNA